MEIRKAEERSDENGNGNRQEIIPGFRGIARADPLTIPEF
jgi:hypothetical protein